MEPVRVAVVQVDASDDVLANLSFARASTAEARGRGAAFVAFPENFLYSGRDLAFSFDPAEWTPRLADLARENRVHLLAGSIQERSPEPGERRHWNTSILFAPDGSEVARYRKIHLFDVDLPGQTPERESADVIAGERAVVARTPLFDLGMSVCYDLRFPELYRALARAGARVLAVPAAFRMQTGRDHWLPLLTARAIENQCFVLAPGQTGGASIGRQLNGRSCVIDPWGVPLAVAPDGPGVIVADLDLARQDQVRARVPCLRHARLLDRLAVEVSPGA